MEINLGIFEYYRGRSQTGKIDGNTKGEKGENKRKEIQGMVPKTLA